MTLRPKFRHWANCNCKYDKLYSTVGGKPLLGCRTRRIPSEPRQSVLVILQERMAIYLKIYVLHGSIRDSCTRAHGRLVTPLILAISIAPLQVLYYSEALPTTARILYRSFTPKRTCNCKYKGLAQGPYVAAIAGA